MAWESSDRSCAICEISIEQMGPKARYCYLEAAQ